MTWGIPSDPTEEGRFVEAVDWFRSLVIMTDSEWRTLTDTAKRKGFKLARVAQLDVVTDVWRAIDKALTRGEDFRDFKKRIKEHVAKGWRGARLDTVFRTNVQKSYGAGRWVQATQPDTLGLRPYWMFDAVLDAATTPTCSACDGTVLPADDPWWQTHHAPLHFNCRSGFVTLTADQAEARGVAKKGPNAKPDSGFGLEPGADEWQPSKDDYPADLWSVYEDKAT